MKSFPNDEEMKVVNRRFPRFLGKTAISGSLSKTYGRILHAKAGIPTNGPLVNRDAMLPPIIQTLKGSHISGSPSLNSSLDYIRSGSTYRSGYKSDGDEPLPHISMTSGVIEKPSNLLTFQQYVKA